MGMPALLRQSFSQPNHLASLVYFVPRILAEYARDRLRPGTESSATTVTAAAFTSTMCASSSPSCRRGDHRIRFDNVHHVDVGGGTPGSIGLSREIFQEGVIIPPVQFLREGRSVTMCSS